MSGSSMDGLDCGLFDLSLSEKLNLSWSCKYFHTFPFSSRIRQLINKAILGDEKSIINADLELGKLFSNIVVRIIDDRIDLLASHGQTISHVDGHSTRQIGNLSFLKKKCNIPLINNFRQADIDVGGNGAPLVPFLDWILFKKSKLDTITLNLGGIANLSYIPRSGIRKHVIGFDTGPGMALIDEAAKMYFSKDMDENGLIANSGNVNIELLNLLMKEKFILKQPPKSTGRDMFGKELVNKINDIFPRMKAEDVMRTFSFFTAKSISINIENFLNIDPEKCRLIISGGGVKHQILMSDISICTKILDIKKSDDFGIDSKMKESLLMAVLGLAKMIKFPANMPSVTGAKKQEILGEIN